MMLKIIGLLILSLTCAGCSAFSEHTLGLQELPLSAEHKEVLPDAQEETNSPKSTESTTSCDDAIPVDDLENTDVLYVSNLNEYEKLGTDSDGDIYKVDFIFVSDINNSIEPQKLWVGDSFFDLTLEEIEYSYIVVEGNKFYVHDSVFARFSGEIIVSGDLVITTTEESFPARERYFFVMNQASDSIPRLMTSGRADRFEFINPDKLIKLLGISEDDIFACLQNDDIIFNDLTIKISNYNISFAHAGSASDFAEIVEIIAYD